MIKDLTTGLQHLGIPAWNLNTSIEFYEKLGFKVIHRKQTYHNDTPVEAAFVQLHEFVIELYELQGEDLAEVKCRQNGHVDHFAINAIDVEKLFEVFQATNFELIDHELQHIDFFDKGVKFFRIMGPSKEVIEFNQIL